MTMGSKFDESWAHKQLHALQRCKDPDSFNPVSRVTKGADSSSLDQTALAFLNDKWREVVQSTTGLASYEELAARVRNEYHARPRVVQLT